MFIKSVIVELRKRGTFMGSKQNEKVSTVIERFRNRKLAYKISVAVASLLGVCLLISVC